MTSTDCVPHLGLHNSGDTAGRHSPARQLTWQPGILAELIGGAAGYVQNTGADRLSACARSNVRSFGAPAQAASVTSPLAAATQVST